MIEHCSHIYTFTHTKNPIISACSPLLHTRFRMTDCTKNTSLARFDSTHSLHGGLYSKHFDTHWFNSADCDLSNRDQVDWVLFNCDQLRMISKIAISLTVISRIEINPIAICPIVISPIEISLVEISPIAISLIVISPIVISPIEFNSVKITLKKSIQLWSV